MEYSNRTMRRKIKKDVASIIANIQSAASNNQHCAECLTEATFPILDIHMSQDENNIVSEMPEMQFNAHTDEFLNIPAHIDSLDLYKDGKFSDASDDTDSERNEYENEAADEYCTEFDIHDKLCFWATSYNISQAAFTALLHILWLAGLDVPQNARTLLETPEDTPVKQIAGGNYYHFGIANGILASLRQNACLTGAMITNLSLNIDVDGLPLFHSSNVQLWPILGSIAGLAKANVFVIGLFAGSSKPANIAVYLSEFVFDMKQLIQTGITYLNRHYTININAIICDAPARSFIKCIKGHGGYNACERCIQEGKYIDHRMTYPELHTDLRTDADFRTQKDDDHHLPNVRSPLLELNIGLVSHCALDYMHLICLGIVKRLISLWIKGNLQYRLPASVVNNISGNLIRMRSHMPREFARQPRSLIEYKHWKATEFRQLLLYSGAVVLRDVLPLNMYNNFVCLSVAMICMLRPEFASNLQYCDYAEKLLINFVTNFAAIYGAGNVVYNVHSAIHLAQDSRKFGSLDGVSAFPFENFLGQLKKMVRRPQNPISQVVRRIYEKDRAASIGEKTSIARTYAKEHFIGPVPLNFPQEAPFRQYKHFKKNDLFVSSSIGNNCFEIHGKLSLIRNILLTSANETFVIYSEFIQLEPFYKYPLDSTVLDIFLASHVSEELKYIPELELGRKFVIMPWKNSSFVLKPLLHQE